MFLILFNTQFSTVLLELGAFSGYVLCLLGHIFLLGMSVSVNIWSKFALSFVIYTVTTCLQLLHGFFLG